ncbi:MAG TPA: DUF1830 domain-containing protein [Candidatus Obscuribacterales bacterium]
MVVAFTANPDGRVLTCSHVVYYGSPFSLMAQILDSLPFDQSEPMLCCYVNATSKMQVVRITNIHNWYFERVVFPGQRLMFEALPAAQLEIHTGMMASAILSDTIPCDRLGVDPEEQQPWQQKMTTAVDSAEPAVVSAGS